MGHPGRPSGSQGSLPLLVGVGIFCVSLICYNLSTIQSQVETTMMAEPGSRRQRMVEGLVSSMKIIVGRSKDKDMDKVIYAVKSKLAQDVEDALAEETQHILATAESGLNQQLLSSIDKPAPASLAVPAADASSPATVMPEDIDAAVEKRADELATEMRLNPSKKHGYYIAGWVKHPPWPFQKINDAHGKDTGVIALCAPFIKYYYNSEWEKAIYWRLKADGHIMLGITSYEWFPGNSTNPFTDRSPQLHAEDKKIYATMDGFIHCFREPWLHIPPGVPRAMISQSDFVNPDSGDLVPKGLQKEYLFAYSNLAGDWNDFNRNWTVAKECIKLAAANGHKVILIGKQKDADKSPSKIQDLKKYVDQGLVELTDTLGHSTLAEKMEKSKFFFIPNESDASPRVAAEALSRGTPLLMNYHIAGGWKYVNDQTGVFFDGVDDFLPAVQRLEALRQAGKLRPREWYRENFGPKRASLKLQAFIEIIAGKEKMENAKKLPKNW